MTVIHAQPVTYNEHAFAVELHYYEGKYEAVISMTVEEARSLPEEAYRHFREQIAKHYAVKVRLTGTNHDPVPAEWWEVQKACAAAPWQNFSLLTITAKDLPRLPLLDPVVVRLPDGQEVIAGYWGTGLWSSSPGDVFKWTVVKMHPSFESAMRSVREDLSVILIYALVDNNPALPRDDLDLKPVLYQFIRDYVRGWGEEEIRRLRDPSFVQKILGAVMDEWVSGRATYEKLVDDLREMQQCLNMRFGCSYREEVEKLYIEARELIDEHKDTNRFDPDTIARMEDLCERWESLKWHTDCFEPVAL